MRFKFIIFIMFVTPNKLQLTSNFVWHSRFLINYKKKIKVKEKNVVVGANSQWTLENHDHCLGGVTRSTTNCMVTKNL